MIRVTAVATIFITAALGYLGGKLLITSRSQAKLERDKWLRARQYDVRRDIRAAVASLASALVAFAHSIMWFTYNASRWAGPPQKEVGDAYSAEVHKHISEVVSLRVRLAALNETAYDRITPPVSEIIRLSERVNTALVLRVNDPQGGETALESCNADALTSGISIVLYIASISSM